eukprot:3790123-Lingulodinium_polyedra.AAC.1
MSLRAPDGPRFDAQQLEGWYEYPVAVPVHREPDDRVEGIGPFPACGAVHACSSKYLCPEACKPHFAALPLASAECFLGAARYGPRIRSGVGGAP